MVRMKAGIREHMNCAHAALVNGQRPPLHGHTYKVDVSVEGDVRDGIVFDFCELRKIVKDALSKYDKKNLNDLMENSTCENLVLALYADIRGKLPKELKLSLKVWQGQSSWAEYMD